MKRLGCDLERGLDVALPLPEVCVIFLWDKIFPDTEGLVPRGDPKGIDTWNSGSCSVDGSVIGGVSLFLDLDVLYGRWHTVQRLLFWWSEYNGLANNLSSRTYLWTPETQKCLLIK